MSIIEKARLFAVKRHGDQKYGDLPYEYHLQRVVEAFKKYYPMVLPYDQEDQELLEAACWLHDSIEDANVSFDEILEEFGRHVARWVWAVSAVDGRNRKEKNKNTYPKILAGGREPTAIKLADRIANIEHSLAHNHGMFDMYKGEYEDFKYWLHIPGELKGMWARLDVLMATVIEPPKEKKNA